MDPKVTGLLLIIFVLGAAVGGGAVYWWAGEYYNPQIKQLKAQYQVLQDQKEAVDQQYLALSTSFQNILKEKEALSKVYATLTQEYASLQTAYSQLDTSYKNLRNEYNKSLDYLLYISNNVSHFQNILESYSILTKSFPRTLTESEMNKVNSTTSGITNYSLDEWINFGIIYNWLKTNIVLVKDTSFPRIFGIESIYYKNQNVVNSFSMELVYDYIQVPEFTVKNKQGDGEDYILAEYAMNYVYMKYTLKKMYQMYLGVISLEGGDPHAIIMLKAGNGLVSIMDPIGGFWTTKNGNMAYESVDSEFIAYESYYNIKKTPLKEVTLYKINPEDGSSIIVSKGTLESIKNVFN